MPLYYSKMLSTSYRGNIWTASKNTKHPLLQQLSQGLPEMGTVMRAWTDKRDGSTSADRLPAQHWSRVDRLGTTSNVN